MRREDRREARRQVIERSMVYSVAAAVAGASVGVFVFCPCPLSAKQLSNPVCVKVGWRQILRRKGESSSCLGDRHTEWLQKVPGGKCCTRLGVCLGSWAGSRECHGMGGAWQAAVGAGMACRVEFWRREEEMLPLQSTGQHTHPAHPQGLSTHACSHLKTQSSQ